MHKDSEVTTNRTTIGIGVAAIALLALVGGFLLGRSGSEASEVQSAASALATTTAPEPASAQGTVDETASASESGEPPEAIAAVDTGSSTDSATSSSITEANEPEVASSESVNQADETTTTTAPAPQQADGQLFADNSNSAAQWATNNPNDPRAATIASEIGSQPIARWFGDWNNNVGQEVAQYVNRATAAGAVPSLVAYNIPDRDCGQHSSGGAANFAQYNAWISSFASGLGDSGALIILEPDALALNDCAGSDRNDAIANAVQTIKNACASCNVYLDAGHSNWVAPADMANRLIDAGVLDSDGFFTNVSNYNATGPEAAFGDQVLDALGNPSGLAQVIDTSRNGNGANGEWCDAEDRAIGADPTLQTGTSTVDAYLWIKVPGEADGCIAGAGEFVPERAFELANG